MKKLFLVISIVSLTQLHGITLEKFKERLFLNQCQLKSSVKGMYRDCLMDEKRYNQLIEPYLQEASRELKIVHYCLNSDTELAKEYANLLVLYSAAAFRQMALNERYKGSHPASLLKNRLKDTIKEYQNTVDPTLNAQKEFDATIDLFKRANEDYYKKLGMITKLAFWGQWLIDRVLFRVNVLKFD
jgi:hypothetical protein